MSGIIIILSIRHILFVIIKMGEKIKMYRLPFLESKVYKGVRESSLYQRINATESSGVGGVMSHGRATFPLTTAVYRMEAVGRG